MSAIADRIEPHNTQSPKRPQGQVPHVRLAGVLVRAQVAQASVREFAGSSSLTEGNRSASGMNVTVDEFGNYVVSDPCGFAYGTGATVESALRDFDDVLVERMNDLRKHREALSPTLRSQLELVERLFPNR